MAANNNEVLNDPELINLLAQMGGANSVDLVAELQQVKEMDEFSLADRLGMDVKMVRKILYRLYDHRLVKFRRIKDEETGWYIYIWKFDDSRLISLVDRLRREKIKKLRKDLEFEKNHQFFICENGCARMTFEEAMQHGFVCPHCGGKMNFFDNSKIIKQLEEHLKQLEKTVGL